MSTMTGTLNAVGGVVGTLNIPAGQTATVSITSAAFTGSVAIQRGLGLSAWETVASISAAPGSYLITEPGDYRVRCAAIGGGQSVSVAITDTDDIAYQWFNRNGVAIMTLYESGNLTAIGTVDVTGDIRKNHVRKSANYSAVANDFVECDTATTSFTVTLPPLSAATAGDEVEVQLFLGSNPVTVEGDGSDTINGSANKTLSTLKESYKYSANSDLTDWIEH